MSKDDTTMLKGIAILMMLWLHLFSNQAFAADCTPLLWFNGTPVATIFARACGPVDFFLVCSGYGLAYVYHRNKLNLASQARRLRRLYLNYWLILAIFVAIGCFVNPERFPGSLSTFIKNFTGWDTNAYDHPAWFLFPYALLSLSSPVIFKVIDRLGKVKATVVALVLSYASMFVISRYIAPANNQHEWYAMIFTYFDLMFPFVFGAAINYQFEGNKKITISKLHKHQPLVIVLLISWFAVHMITGSAAVGPFFFVAFMIIYLNLNIRGIFRKVLLELGRKSMPMWLIHAFFYSYLCHDFVFSFRYPLLIFLALVAMSYLAAIVILQISKKIIRR